MFPDDPYYYQARAYGYELVDDFDSALEDYTRPEPLPWSDFYISRGRALAAHGRGERGEELREQLRELNVVGLS